MPGRITVGLDSKHDIAGNGSEVLSIARPARGEVEDVGMQ